MPLTDLACRTAKPALKLRKLSDMGGLQLWLFPNGSKLWRYAYRYRGRQKLLALGKYPATTLAQARAKREDARTILQSGEDPSRLRMLQRLEHEAPGDTFNVIADEYIAKLRREGRADRTIAKVSWLLDFARPLLGEMGVGLIRPIDVLTVLRKIEKRGRHETARRLRSTIGAVCRYAVATARAESDPTAPLTGALTTPTSKPRAAITDPKALGALLRAIDVFNGQMTLQQRMQYSDALVKGYINYLGTSEATGKWPSWGAINQLHWKVNRTVGLGPTAYGGTPLGSLAPNMMKDVICPKCAP